MNGTLAIQAEMLTRKIKHYLITTMGVTLDEANPEEFYRAFSLTLREEIMINWTGSLHSYRKKQPRMLYYLCMEYMPGRFLGNNIINIHAQALVNKVMESLGKKLCDEECFEPDPGLGNGGLGRLAACFLDALATQQYPAIAYGLRYQYGIFDQEIWGGRQVERPDTWLLHENPWEYRRDTHATSVYYAGRTNSILNKKGVEVLDLIDYEEVRALAYDIPIIGYREGNDFNVNTLRLWTTKESPRNFALQRYNAGFLDQAAENTSLTDVLYPNDNNEMGKRIRLKQEFLLSSASLQDIIKHHLHHHPDMTSFADKARIHINDTHPSIVIAELMRLLLKEHDLGWGEAWDIVRTCCHFTNHTILKESLEEWNQNRFRYLLPSQYQIIERLNLEFCNAIRLKFPGDEAKVRRMSIIEEGQVKMANLAIYGSRTINGVAALHTEILKNRVFQDFYEMYPEKFKSVTNGVTPRRWLLCVNPQLSSFISERIGKEWITDFSKIKKLEIFAQDPKTGEAFLAIKKEKKKELLEFLKKANPIRDLSGKPMSQYVLLDENALFDVHIKRIHEYKRQLMSILHTIILYYEIKADKTSRKVKRQMIYAGKAAPGYTLAKNIIQLITCVARKIAKDPDVAPFLSVVFVENYNVSHAEKLIPAADLSEQISTAGTEASGTSNMKLAMNGSLTIGTEDGANVEMRQQIGDAFWPFRFGKTAPENEAMVSSESYNPWDIYIHDSKIHQAVDALRDQAFAETQEEHESHLSLYHSLLSREETGAPDRYFVLSDLQDYYATQKKVEELFSQPQKWAEYALHNIAGMGAFSADATIHNYAKEIWQLASCPVDSVELEKVRAEYSEHDKCRIF